MGVAEQVDGPADVGADAAEQDEDAVDANVDVANAGAATNPRL